MLDTKGILARSVILKLLRRSGCRTVESRKLLFPMVFLHLFTILDQPVNNSPYLDPENDMLLRLAARW